jgi:glutaminase
VDTASAVHAALESIVDDARALTGGEVASYIPELAHADPALMGIAIAGVRGGIYEAGDTAVPFTLQSVSKPFVYALALEARGQHELSVHVGVEPSGEPFNAPSVEPGSGRPKNPMINAGAIVVASLMAGDTAEEKFATIRAGLEAFAGHSLEVDEAVYRSEQDTGYANRALAELSSAVLGSAVDVATQTYFRQCSVLATARDVAIMSATLANAGINPITGQRVVSELVARWTLSVMASCGMYDASGDWLARVGLPAKSGVSGGIAAVNPAVFGIGAYSPPLDATGNSLRSIAMLEALSSTYGLHMFTHPTAALEPAARELLEAARTS